MMDRKRGAAPAEGLEEALARAYKAELAAHSTAAGFPSEPPPELLARALAPRRPRRAAARPEPLRLALALAASLALGLCLPWSARRPSELAAGIASAWGPDLAAGLREGFLGPLLDDLTSSIPMREPGSRL